MSDSGWFRIDNAAIDAAAEVGPAAFAVYAALCRHADAGRRCWPSLSRLGELTGLKRRAVQYGIGRLESAGWLVVERKTGQINRYYLPPLGPVRVDAPVHQDAPDPCTRMHQTRAPTCTRNKTKEQEPRTRSARTTFAPPTLQEVTAYCKQRQNQVDPQRFVDYYTSNGWHVGRSPMKDWRAAVRSWERNRFGNGESQDQGPLRILR